MPPWADEVLVLGAGLAGLTAGSALADAGTSVRVLESAPSVGGLARTVAHGSFRFDLGGHRFFTEDPALDALVRGVLGRECLTVGRKSQILLRGRLIDYPLRPLNALGGLGVLTTSRILMEHAIERVRSGVRRREPVSLEDWVVTRFGRTLFELYFHDYSEKIWGIPCEDISADWVAQRIQGLSLGAAVRNAFSPRAGPRIRTLVDRFTYPARGIGALADRLRERIESASEVRCGVEVVRVHHDGSRVTAVTVREGSRHETLPGAAFVSTVPLTELVRMLEPRPPAEVLAAAAHLRFRDLVVVALMLDRERATDQSWVYFPDRSIPFGRIHEPTNWSPWMAPAGKTLLVAERFCFEGDDAWSASDEALAGDTADVLARLGTIRRSEVVDSAVVRVPKAYPLFDVGYRRHCALVRSYVAGFPNLVTAGRGGTFSYHNMDHAMASGLAAAARLLGAGLGAAALRPAAAAAARSRTA